ncbi:MAG: hypothetical protein IIB15_08245, partial [Chloroflexi bacterium]|nr:hypothetical protein [Chloroflexota bacterium]
MLKEKGMLVVAALGADGGMRVAVAASRAGAVGVLNLEGVEETSALEAMSTLCQHARGEFGVRLGVGQASLLEQIASRPSSGLAYVVLSGLEQDGLKEQISHLSDAGLKALVESISLEEGLSAQEAGAWAVIAKGNESGGRVGEETACVLFQR